MLRHIQETVRLLYHAYFHCFPVVAGINPAHRCKRHAGVAMSEDDVILMNKAMTSVGVISYSGMTGTAFRVGTKYVMTAAHIVRDIVGKCIYLQF